MYALEGNVAVVTGAASGIGLATAERLVREGAIVSLVDSDPVGLERAAVELTEFGLVRSWLCDIADPESVDEIFANIASAFGRLDLAFNNAGIAGPHRTVEAFSDKEYESIIDTNVRGTWQCLRAELNLMRESGRGSIVNTASALGLVGARNQALYTASKHAIVGLTRSAALDVGSCGVRINAVCPGVISTPLVEAAVRRDDPSLLKTWEQLHPIGRVGSPVEVAAAVVWLLSSEASFVHGAVLSVDGGYVAQ